MDTKDSNDIFTLLSKSSGEIKSSSCSLCPDCLMSAKKVGSVKAGSDYIAVPDKGIIAVLVYYDTVTNLFQYHKFQYTHLCASAFELCGIKSTHTKFCVVKDTELEFVSKKDVIKTLLSDGFTTKSLFYKIVQGFSVYTLLSKTKVRNKSAQ